MEIKAIIRWSKAISWRGETWSALYLDLYLTSKVFAAVLLKKAVMLPSILAIDFYFRKKHNLGLHVCKAMKSQSQGWTAFVILYIVNSYLNLRKQLLFHISIPTDNHSLKEWMCPNHLQYSKNPLFAWREDIQLPARSFHAWIQTPNKTWHWNTWNNTSIHETKSILNMIQVEATISFGSFESTYCYYKYKWEDLWKKYCAKMKCILFQQLWATGSSTTSHWQEVQIIIVPG